MRSHKIVAWRTGMQIYFADRMAFGNAPPTKTPTPCSAGTCQSAQICRSNSKTSLASLRCRPIPIHGRPSDFERLSTFITNALIDYDFNRFQFINPALHLVLETAVYQLICCPCRWRGDKDSANLLILMINRIMVLSSLYRLKLSRSK